MPADPARVRRLQAWLEHLSDAASSGRVVNGIGNTLAAVLVGALGVGVLGIHSSSETSNTLSSRNFSAGLLLGVSAGYAYAAITDLVPTTNEERLERWQSLAGHIDLPTLARFESELAAEAEVARWLRLKSYGTWLGIAAAGGLMMAVTPGTKLDSGDRTLSYGVGASLLGLGGLALILTLTNEPENARAYRLYREGKKPDTDDDDASEKEEQAQIRVSPAFGAHDLGLMVSGRF